jgi:RNA polymerase sigma-70 factor (ECF subfamily)
VIQQLHAFVRRAIERTVGRQADARSAVVDDLTQDATLKVLDSLASFRGDSRLSTWVTTIAVRQAITELRRARWKDVSLNQFTDDERPSSLDPASPAESAQSGAIKAEMFSALHQAMETSLSSKQRTALDALLAGMPLHEIADQMQTNANALYKLLHDARKKLRDALDAAGYSEADVRNVLADAS